MDGSKDGFYAPELHAVNVGTSCEFCDVEKHLQGDLHSQVILFQMQECGIVKNFDQCYRFLCL